MVAQLHHPYPVWVRVEGTWRPGIGRTVPDGHAGRPAAVRTYRARFSHTLISDADPFVVVTLLPTDTAMADTIG